MLTEEARHKLIWGWLRFFLAFAQISLVPMAVGAGLAVGPWRITWMFIIGATVAAVISRLIYRGRKDPNLEAPRT